MRRLLERIGFRQNRKPAETLLKNFEKKQVQEWFGGGASSLSGVEVTPQGSLRIAAVFSCVRILSESVASAPLHLYQRTTDENGRERNVKAIGHPVYSLIRNPNEIQTTFEFVETLQGALSLRGNAFAFIDWSISGTPKQLIPLAPDRVGFAQLDDGSIRYSYDTPKGLRQYFSSDDILHLRGLSTDGIAGLSPIDTAREAVGLSLAAEEFGARFYSNGTHVGTYLETPNELGEEARKNLKESFADKHQGLANSHKIPLLEGGVKMNRMNMSAADAQFIESRRFQLLEICRMFRVPPHKIYDLERATFSNIEAQSVDFVTDSIRPWLSRWEARLAKSLLTPEEREEYFFGFDLTDLLRGETKARQESLQIMRRNGVISANEWRAIENMNPREDEGGDTYFEDLALTNKDSKNEEGSDSSDGEKK